MRICTLCLQNYSKYIITFEDNSEKYFLGIVAKKILSLFLCARSTKKKNIYICKFISPNPWNIRKELRKFKYIMTQATFTLISDV